MLQGSRIRSETGVPPALARELQSLEQQAKEASPGYETQFLNRAANLCMEAGHTDKALGFYGKAIDAYLESGRFNAAEVVCRKILKMAPGTVRARCTLTWLAIGKEHRTGTQEQVSAYVEAARVAGRDSLAAKQIRLMANAAPSVELRELLAEYLLDLGDAEGADAVFGRVYAEANGLRSAPVEDQAKLWAKMVRGALMGPEELKLLTRAGSEQGVESDEMIPGLITGLD
jgi:tetratricopeptide (TPR) repeat protein